ncbi:MAG: BspA family leucine-rich repeat surface protein [Flavobacteriales bacterium]|nr:BspA family leucine-rich repeat surface protein [Flavobacteriales bacterium]
MGFRGYFLFFILGVVWANTNWAQSFITTWKTDNTGSSNNSSITIAREPFTLGYNYDVDWDNDGVFDQFGITGTITHDFGAPGTYTIRIQGSFPRIHMPTSGDESKLLSIDQWGSIAWTSMEDAFKNCSNLTYNASDNPDLSGVTSMWSMFQGCTSFNGNIGGWDVSNVTNIGHMFQSATSFNQSIDAWNTAAMTNFESTFALATSFNQSLNSWNTANVTIMRFMFEGASVFNGNISSWNTGNVTTFNEMFQDAVAFNQDIGSWNTSSATDIGEMFNNAQVFNQDLNWDVSNVSNMYAVFYNAYDFNGDISSWNTSSATTMQNMFTNCNDFNQDLSGWNTGNVTNMTYMFYRNFVFDQDLSGWNVGNVTNMYGMFQYAQVFNQDLNSWNVSSVQNMGYMFAYAYLFNQDLNSWNTSSVTYMGYVFRQAWAFNGDISSWNTSSVNSMRSMFNRAYAFNQDISGWDITNVSDIQYMFRTASAFNQDLSAWNTSNLTNINYIFENASALNHDLSAWDVTGITTMVNALSGTGLDLANYDKTIIGWQAQAVQNNVNLGATGLNYCNSETARNTLVSTNSWSISGDSKDCMLSHFVTTWKTDNAGTSSSTQITIPTTGAGYNYDVDWNNDGTFDQLGITGSVTHDYGVVGTYTIRIRGAFPRIFFSNVGDKLKLLSVDQWGSISWSSMSAAFYGCANLSIPALDAPDLSLVNDMSSMLHSCSSLNVSLSHWNTSNITNMFGLFTNCTLFNGNVSDWNTSNVTNMNSMFQSTSFNQNIGSWDTQNVISMDAMFKNCSAFNQNIGLWDVSNATNLSDMFLGASNFNQDIGGWNTSSVTTMRAMFQQATAFNQNLNSWNTASVLDMFAMFWTCPNFNQDISTWNTSSVTEMSHMLAFCSSFNQDLSNWNITSVTQMTSMLDNCGMDITNYDKTLIGWDAQAVQNGVNLGAAGLTYCSAETQRANLISSDSWTITGDSKNCMLTHFVTTWKTDNSGVSNSTSITIPTTGGGYNYDVDWDNDGTFDQMGITGSVTHDFGSAGTYTIRIQGSFPRLYFYYGGDKLKVMSLDQWGSIAWTSFQRAFYGCENMVYNATDVPDLSGVTNLDHGFASCEAMNGDLSGWNTSTITSMYGTFASNDVFNPDLSNWNTSNVTDMRTLFNGCLIFNNDITNWNTSNVTHMGGMFAGAKDFNQDIGDWDVSQVTSMSNMFYSASDFNQDIGDWNTSSVNSMRDLFHAATSFDQDIGRWNASNVNDMTAMFQSASAFNQDISGWNTSSVTTFVNMFRSCPNFNQPIGIWNTSSAVDMRAMFFNATSFDQDIGLWDVSGVTNMTDMLDNTNLSVVNYDNTLFGWAETASFKSGSSGGSTMAVQPNVPLGVAGLQYCNAVNARQNLIDNDSWVISGDADVCGGLPIELSSFKAIPREQHVDIIWATQTEIDNDYFEIQKSLDMDYWEPFATIAGAGNSNQILEYYTIDEDPIEGVSYYRIKQVDFDGHYSYSFPQMVEYKKDIGNSAIKVYPSPGTDIIFVESLDQDLSTIEFYNSMGQQLPLTFLNNSANQRTYDISKLPSGIYHLTLGGRVQSFMKK